MLLILVVDVWFKAKSVLLTLQFYIIAIFIDKEMDYDFETYTARNWSFNLYKSSKL